MSGNVQTTEPEDPDVSAEDLEILAKATTHLTDALKESQQLALADKLRRYRRYDRAVLLGASVLIVIAIGSAYIGLQDLVNFYSSEAWSGIFRLLSPPVASFVLLVALKLVDVIVIERQRRSKQQIEALRKSEAELYSQVLRAIRMKVMELR